MSPAARRRRALLLLSLSLACGGLAASEVSRRIGEVEAAVGAPVPVLVAARELGPGDQVGSADVAVRDVPERFVPPDALASESAALGLPVAASLAAGSYVTAGAFARAGASGASPRALRRGERAVEVSVAGGESLGEAAGPGTRVDVLVSTEPREGPGRTLLALEDVELLDLRPGAGGGPLDAPEGGAGATGSGQATLRVTLRQAVYLTAAQNFAREVRLLPRPPGERRSAGAEQVTADGL